MGITHWWRRLRIPESCLNLGIKRIEFRVLTGLLMCFVELNCSETLDRDIEG